METKNDKEFDEVFMNDTWEKKWIKNMKYLEENYLKEIEDYNKIFNRKIFKKIINSIKKINKYKIEFNVFYNGTYIKTNDEKYKYYFKLFDFFSPDGKEEMEDYLKGKKYYLELIIIGEENIDIEYIEKAYSYIKELKEIIDKVIGEVL